MEWYGMHGKMVKFNKVVRWNGMVCMARWYDLTK